MSRFTPGDLIVHTSTECRRDAAPVHTRTVARVLEVHDDIGFLVAKPLRVFCWVEGHFDLGRHLPPSRGPLGYAEDEPRPVFD